jgi:hypothetical protein
MHRELDTKTMPEKIVLGDGTEREVPTADEMKGFQEAKEQLEKIKPVTEQFETLKTTLGLQEGENLTDKLKELQESANPNWQKARTVIKTLKQVAKDKGVDVDDDGNIITQQKSISPDEMQKIADETFNKRSAESKKADILAKFSKEDSASISAIFDKLQSVGGSFEENMGLAIDKIIPNSSKDIFRSAITSAGGGGPRIKTEQSGSLSEDAKKFGMEKFGLTEEDFNKLN